MKKISILSIMTCMTFIAACGGHNERSIFSQSNTPLDRAEEQVQKLKPRHTTKPLVAH
jgi:hypothetical protein